MANLLQLINKTSLINKKAEDIVQDIINKYNHGKIKTQTDLTYQILVKLKLFYESINKPVMIPRHVSSLPNVEDINTTINEAIDDINTIYQEADTLLSSISEAFNQVEFDRSRINSAIKLIEQLYKKADTAITDLEYNDIFIEDFTDTDKFNKSAISNDPVNINNTFGYISLSLKDNKLYNDKIETIEIQGSNGFPGNTHIAESIDDNVRFLGEDGIYADLNAIIDNNADTWFEYELFTISNDTYIKTLGLGFNYEEGLRWITMDDKTILKLCLVITFNDYIEMNALSLSPFIQSDKDAIASNISNITLSNNRGTTLKLDSISFDREKVYLFPKQEVKTLTLEFEQPYAYETNIGHIYYEEITTDSINYFSQNELKSNKRVKGTMPSSSNIGIIYNDETQSYSSPNLKTNYSPNKLFSIPEVEKNIKGTLELIKAKRFNINIKDILCECNKYNEVGEYVSIEYETETPISSIMIEAEEDYPNIFEEYDKDFIQYYISLDRGSNWYEIIPQGLFKRNGYNKYIVNSKIPEEMYSDNVGYIETNSDEYKISVKIILSRPQDLNDYSPIVYNYTLYTM